MRYRIQKKYNVLILSPVGSMNKWVPTRVVILLLLTSMSESTWLDNKSKTSIVVDPDIGKVGHMHILFDHMV